jgi:hypothetical protein
MKSIDMPRREAWANDVSELAKLDSDPRPQSRPEELPLAEIVVLPSLFQPRGQSLGFCPGASARHVEEMARAVKYGRLLDAVAVVAFGSAWVLVDGHHRIAAYNEAGYAASVPVAVHDCNEAGQDRVAWAVALSTRLNAKDKLSMSADDKVDSAWRLVVMVGYDMTKEQLVEASTVKDRTIASMRAVRKALLEANHSPESLYDMTWRRAKWEMDKLNGEASDADPDWEERRMRELMRKLSPAIDERLPALTLLEALERLRPGLEIELESAIQLAKERRQEPRRIEELLDV